MNDNHEKRSVRRGMETSRRDFLSLGALATAATSLTGCAGWRVQSASAPVVDPNLSAFLSDIHVSGRNVKKQPTYQNPLFEKAIDQVLALNPRPKRALIFGDVALWSGRNADYEESLPQIKRLKEAGIDVYLTTGNHDHREPLFRFHPHQLERTPVPGRLVSVVDVGTADFILLDTLQENPEGEGSSNKVDGALDAAQADWFLAFAEAAKRPFFCGGHHPPQELKVRGKDLLQHLETNQQFCGYIHGHNHRWDKDWHHFGYSRLHVLRSACLPSTGWWGDIGFATFRTSADRATLSLVQNDFFFPRPLTAGAKRPPEWNEILHENAGAVCTFPYAI